MPGTEGTERTAGARRVSAGDEAGLGFAISVAEAEDATLVTIFGELDLAASPRVREALGRASDAGGQVEVDLRACTFVDSTGIATLVGAARRLSEDGRTLKIRGAHERVRRIFDLAGLLSHSWIELGPEPAPG